MKFTTTLKESLEHKNSISLFPLISGCRFKTSKICKVFWLFLPYPMICRMSNGFENVGDLFYLQNVGDLFYLQNVRYLFYLQNVCDLFYLQNVRYLFYLHNVRYLFYLQNARYLFYLQNVCDLFYQPKFSFSLCSLALFVTGVKYCFPAGLRDPFINCESRSSSSS